MQCPDCNQLRHKGECAVTEEELEMLAIDAAQASHRLLLAMNRKAAEGRPQHEVTK